MSSHPVHHDPNYIWIGGILMFLEELGVPVPIPSDFILIYSGYAAKIGLTSTTVSSLYLIACALLGTTALFFIAKRVGRGWMINLFTLFHGSTKSVDRVEELFRKYSFWAIIIGRHIPGVRIAMVWVAANSGINYWAFLGATAITVIPWVYFYHYIGIHAGKNIENFLRGHEYIAYIGVLIYIAIFGLLLYSRISKNSKKMKADKVADGDSSDEVVR